MTRAATANLVGRYGLAIALMLVAWCAFAMGCALLGRPLASSAAGYALWIVAGIVTLVQAVCISGTGPGAVAPVARGTWPVSYRLILAATLVLLFVWAWDQFVGGERIPPMGFMPLVGVNAALELAASRSDRAGPQTTTS
ncbi:hypothetical protein [Novosphingobium mangrovi (ex Hu et al. 2023)]|uniref:Uncharacterized protein n=1 Tax=Novosphingobium mangrovi (ex Hu et al. 2023) TaxID=2930094 RepID=A0ABT0A8M5_9SPHN|nr:hypothetical protein [Novosphingobium mangrovi (ex Hu et al. 2023)]MCJ1959558.1 hypothetical protein [Novosphingobium mangrovi (ex Hu et al. 2023)]